MATGRMTSDAPPLTWKNIDAFPVAHGRIGFAIAVRQRLLEQRYAAIAVELPPSLKRAVLSGIEKLPVINVITYQHTPEFLTEDPTAWYLTVDPCDPIMETIRIAQGERTPTHFVDAEIEEFEPRPQLIPDPNALLGLGLQRWYESAFPQLILLRPNAQDKIREYHMAARLIALQQEFAGTENRILFLCGLAHWHRILTLLQGDSGILHSGSPPPEDLIHLHTPRAAQLQPYLSEMPHTADRFERHRHSLELESFDPATGLKDLLLKARSLYKQRFPHALQKTNTRALMTILRYLRKLAVRARRLFPDTYTLVLAARNVVGNDYALCVFRTAVTYEYNRIPRDPAMTEPALPTEFSSDPEARRLYSRVPTEPREMAPLKLVPPPTREQSKEWSLQWNPMDHCSWPPEDLVIENFRTNLGERALSMAGIERARIEPFTSSLKDGISIRDTLLDFQQQRIHVREEPTIRGRVGAVCLIFEEDDFGFKFPWRSTWMAEHAGESTLAFYSTDPEQNMIGPGIGRMIYGGCLFIYPPIIIPDV